MHESFLEIPWLRHGRTRMGADCWGVIALWFSEHLGIDLPSYIADMAVIGENPAERDALIRREALDWPEVTRAESRLHDVVLMRSGRFVLHVGVMINSEFMLHSEGPEGRFPVVQRVDDPAILRRVIGFYRHQAL